MIDIHAHLLPGLDDGAESWDETLAMVRRAAEEGTEAMVATPHMMPDGVWANRAPQVLERLDEAKKRVEDAGLPVSLYPGGEIYLFPGLPEAMQVDRYLVYPGGKHVLVEFPGSEAPGWAEDLFFRLQVRGLTPVLAHPERNAAVMANTKRIVTWIERGLLLQVNARSLLGASGPDVKRAAEELVSRRMVHFIASDAHGSVRRPTGLAGAYERVRQLAGDDAADAVCRVNPLRVLTGEAVPVPEPQPKPRRSLLSRLLRSG